MSGRLIIQLGLTLLPLAACTRANPAYLLLPNGDAAASDRPSDPAQDSGPAADAREPDLPPEAASPAPPSLTVAPGAAGALHGGTMGDPPITSECGSDEALMGYHGADDIGSNYRLVGTLQPVCGQLSFASGQPGTPVQTTGMRLLARQGRTAIMWMELCPTGQVVVSVAGRNDDYLDSLQIGCAPLAIAGDGRSLQRGAITLLPAHGGPLGTPFSETCPEGQVAHGSVVSSGFWIDSLQMICSPVTLAP